LNGRFGGNCCTAEIPVLRAREMLREQKLRLHKSGLSA
jgi:hypothetical protein